MRSKDFDKRPSLDYVAVKRLMSYATGRYKLRCVIVLVCLMVSALANVAGSVFIRVLIDDYISPLLLQSAPVFTELLKVVATMGVIYMSGITATFLYSRIMPTISQGVLKAIRDEMFCHMQTLSLNYFDTRTHGDVMSHYTNDTDTLREMLTHSIPQMFSSVITIMIAFCAMLYLNIPLTILVCVFVAIMLTLTSKLGGKAGVYFFRQQKSIGSVNGYIEEMINGQKVVKVFCHEDVVKADFDKLNDELNRHAASAHGYANILMPIMSNLGHLQYVFIAIVGGALAINGVGSVTLGAIASFLTLSRSFSLPIGMISAQINAVIMAVAGAGRIFNLIDEQSESDDGYVSLVNARFEGDRLVETDEPTGIWAWKQPLGDGQDVAYTELKGEVRLENVDFSYVRDKKVLHDVSLYAKPGQKIAFVGATGAGKTTITNLLNRFYDIEDGKIRYDGINISKIKKPDLRRSLGIVLQDVNLFTGTIIDNIRYGKLDATDDECIYAAKLANAHDFILRLPNGYDTEIEGDGENLSQGQKQLISIARAAVANPPVMILDEATASIDTRTEDLVQKGMDSLMQGRTVFVIAHRLSTIKNSKAIIVLENGRIIERGEHESLISQKGKYYQLYTGVFELE